MRTPKRFLLLLGYVTITLPVMYYYWNTKSHDKTACKTDKQAFSQMKQNLEDLTSKELENVIENDEHEVIYCYILSAPVHPKDKEDKRYAWHMLSLFGHLPEPKPSVRETFTSGLFPSFNNFVQYLLDPQTEKNVPFEPHWRQMHCLCHPCLLKFDFIGHQETLQDDAEELLNLLNLQDDIKFPPSYENMTSPNMVLDWFRTVPLEDRRKLYHMYKEDFRLFGYEKPNSLLDE
ncbi:carbohydrate sulfotransferase 12-like [Thalassophryne amazonica]|uniref:carbohydrate sulfotransferase 12-like n=1 Tax=Thalassophryne amazonica TaxID=390379 RepID=UPI0014725225|nr:carbohydrate sulfotransferase 12-like [Thalassophryne amazonica]